MKSIATNLSRAITSNKEMNDRLYYKFPSRKQPLGNRQTVSTATTAMMRLIQGRYYVPNNSALVITGDVKATDVHQMAQEFFGDWPRREKDPFVEFPMVDHPPLQNSAWRRHQTAGHQCPDRDWLAGSIDREETTRQLMPPTLFLSSCSKRIRRFQRKPGRHRARRGAVRPAWSGRRSARRRTRVPAAAASTTLTPSAMTNG